LGHDIKMRQTYSQQQISSQVKRRIVSISGRQYKVVLINDMVNVKSKVTNTIEKIVNNRQEAEGITEEAHTKGKAVVKICDELREAKGVVWTMHDGNLTAEIQ